MADLFCSVSYETFVAMPFRDCFSYRPVEILSKVIQRAVAQADSEKNVGLKDFSEPNTVEKLPGTANVITEDIVKKILFSHFFIADLTGGNEGVLLETGIAMAFKPNTQIILITQDPLGDLHFDIRNNRIISYNPDGNIATVKDAFLSAARSFEEDRKKYVTQVTQTMTIEAIRTLHWYASLYQNPEVAKGQPGLFAIAGMPPFFKSDYGESQSIVMFKLTLQELHQKRMVWTDYSTKIEGATEWHGWAAHLTKLGWAVVQAQWPHLKSDLCQRIK